MAYMFYYCNALTSLDVSNWDTSRVTDMGSMFYYCQELTELNIKHFNMNKVNATNSMFSNCKKLAYLDLAGWEFSPSFYTTASMFESCSSLVSVDITGWNTNKVTVMNTMFGNCTSLVDIIGEIDASNLTSGLYPGSSSNPFYKCSSLETLYLKNIYKDIAVTNTSKFSINLGVTKVKDECLIYIINELPDLINDKGLTATDKIILTLPPTNTLTAEQVQVAIDKGWTVANTTY
jgi:surface protein